MPELNLLDYIAKCGEVYLSDLHEPDLQRQILPFVLNVEDGCYGIDEWNEALSYILGSSVACSSAREAKEYFQHALSQAVEK